MRRVQPLTCALERLRVAVARHVDQIKDLSLPSVKKLSSRVRPGVTDTRARLVRPVSALIRLDLPTLERPAKAISGFPSGGRPSMCHHALDEGARPLE